MYQILKGTCRAIVFPHQTYCLAALSLPSSSSVLKFEFPNKSDVDISDSSRLSPHYKHQSK